MQSISFNNELQPHSYITSVRLWAVKNQWNGTLERPLTSNSIEMMRS